jgi:hypothetical protein
MQTYITRIAFAKAFDSIVPTKLLFKLEHCYICHLLLKWMDNFSTAIYQHRLQCIVAHVSENSSIDRLQINSVSNELIHVFV